MNLPEKFLDCIKNTLKDDFNDYYKLLNNPPFRGLRVNTVKATSDILNKLNFETEPTPFCKDGFYIDNDLKGVGNNPLHHAGAFYLQEPSAMSAVEALGVEKGDFVLDMCAAPGGKSTQIASKLNGTGLLWSNEYIFSRSKILCSNLERCGVKNSVVSNSDTKLLAENFAGFFDKVLVDAPCSGEGMIRREPNAITEWKEENREMCANRQAEILDNASVCLKENGILVYSTCTLSLEENEMTVDNFLKSHPDFVLEPIEPDFGRNGYTYFTDNKVLSNTRRILFQDGGEGHFVARLRKTSTTDCNIKAFEYKKESNILVDEFFENCFNIIPDYYIKNNIVYILPEFYPEVNGIKIIRAGVKAGELNGKRFTPDHGLFMTSDIKDIRNVLNLSIEDKRIYDFLKGLEIDCKFKGYTAVAVEGIITGFGKASNGRLKNHYPKGLRIL